MRICLVVHGFPPFERTGVENYTAGLAAALTGAGHRVEVFVPRKDESLPQLSLRREDSHGFGVTWLTTNQDPRDPEEMLNLPGAAQRFGDFLDRERPELVHFQHVIKLGVDLISEAAARGIPTVYTAHDYYPICHRFTLLRPDLKRCETLGDSDACARCDLALAWLNRLPELGDYQMGALPEQLDEHAARGLAAVLSAEEVAEGFSAADHAAAAARRRRLDAARLAAFAKLDLVLTPTKYLAERLREGGLQAKRFALLPYGIETEELSGVSPPGARGRSRPIRFGFLGGLSKHKGVHVLLEAFARLTGRAELSLWGGSSDTVYVEAMRERALAVGAVWNGPYEQPALAACIEGVDVVVVPSIWVENYPIVIREAFAAGRPVISSDVGALPESVRDGVDGLLVPPGDAAALGAAMERFVTEPGLLSKLRAGIERVEGMRGQVHDLEAHYESLLAERESALDPNLPPHLRASAERWSELTRMPMRDLLQQVLGGLGRLRVALPGAAQHSSTEQLLGDALASGSRAQLALRDLKREKEWLRETLSSHEEVERALERRLEWREGQLASEENELAWLRQNAEELERERAWLRETVQNQAAAIDSHAAALEESQRARAELERELAWLRPIQTAQAEELEWLKSIRERLEAEAVWLREKTSELEAEVEWRREVGAHLEEELEWLRSTKDEGDKRDAWLQSEIQALERHSLAEKDLLDQSLERARERFRQAAEVGLVALQAQHRIIGNELRPLLDALEEAAAVPDAEGDRGHYEDGIGLLLENIRRGIEMLRGVESELTWRRTEMAGAVEQMNRPLLRALFERTGLVRRVRTWQTAEEAARAAEARRGEPEA